jgi:hypothetical protein
MSIFDDGGDNDDGDNVDKHQQQQFEDNLNNIVQTYALWYAHNSDIVKHSNTIRAIIADIDNIPLHNNTTHPISSLLSIPLHPSFLYTGNNDSGSSSNSSSSGDQLLELTRYAHPNINARVLGCLTKSPDLNNLPRAALDALIYYNMP